jgi:hypothetical protein
MTEDPREIRPKIDSTDDDATRWNAIPETVQKQVLEMDPGLPVMDEKMNEDEAGTVATGELDPEKARSLLKLALVKTQDPAKTRNHVHTDSDMRTTSRLD